MSSSKLQQITRNLTVASTSWSADVLTITFTAGHGLLAGDVLKFQSANDSNTFSAAVASVSGASSETLTVPCTDPLVTPPQIIQTGIWNVGAPTGGQQAFTWGWANNPTGLVQVSTNATGTVSVKVEGSLDGAKWVDAATAQSIGTNSTYIFDITKPYVYGRLNITVGVGGAGGKFTAVRTVA